MSREIKPAEEGFLGRWSRRKTEARDAPPEVANAVPEDGLLANEAPQLPPIEELTLDSDFRGFFHPKVDEGLRRAALRKLFSDPHFNVMDGLDIYIDDYSKTEPIPPEMLAGLRQAQRILRWAEGKDDPPEDAPEDSKVVEAADVSAGVTGAAPAPALEEQGTQNLELAPAAAEAEAPDANTMTMPELPLHDVLSQPRS